MPDVTLARNPKAVSKLSAAGGPSPAVRLLERAVLFALVWWILAEGTTSSWSFGVLFVVLASVVSLQLTPRRGWKLHPLGAASFVGFFLWNSIVSGVDVALRAVRPSMPMYPGFVTYQLRLPGDAARVLLANTISMLPGTLSSELSGDSVVIHVLDCTLPVAEETRKVEERIADALGVELIEESSAPEIQETGCTGV